MADKEKDFQQTQNKKPLAGGQKFLAVVLVFSAIIVFFFGIWQVKRSINSPFERVASSNNNSSASDVGSKSQDTSIMEMQNKDTDEDGLSDYEEFYIYKTSPYLADSDSDTIDDKKEVELGTDPNCQQGKNCGVVDPNSVNVVEPEAEKAENLESELFDFENLDDFDEMLTEDSVSDLFSNLSASEIRELLKETGLPAEILEQLSDEQLLDAYKTTLENMEE